MGKKTSSDAVLMMQLQQKKLNENRLKKGEFFFENAAKEAAK